jgi:hypothetical protein
MLADVDTVKTCVKLRGGELARSCLKEFGHVQLYCSVLRILQVCAHVMLCDALYMCYMLEPTQPL